MLDILFKMSITSVFINIVILISCWMEHAHFIGPAKARVLSVLKCMELYKPDLYYLIQVTAYNHPGVLLK